ncbi:MAG: hypothetical protein QHH75_03255 [Bacillota bacterium]|nr:hypothetical protein [Bacillota bacterium]
MYKKSLNLQKGTRRVVVQGEPPNLINPPPGCRFYPRYPQVREEYRRIEPGLKGAGEGNLVACHLS